MTWDIGKEAKELDEKSIKERVKIGRRSIVKIVVAIGIYFLTMYIFWLVL